MIVVVKNKLSCATLCRHINARRGTNINETTVRRRVLQNNISVPSRRGLKPSQN